ncbi:hypothetical protein D3C79_794100 [compost metagenome]
MQIGPFRWSDTLAGPEKIVMAIDQFGRQQAFTDQLLRPVDIGQHRIEQSCALFNTRRQLLPFGGGQQVRQQVQLPRPVGTLGVGIDVVGDAVLAQLAGQRGLALGQLRRPAALQVGTQGLPMLTHRALAFEHLVIGPRTQRVSIKQVRHGNARRPQVSSE